MLKIPYVSGGLRDQPRWYVREYPAFVEGKNKAEKALNEKKPPTSKKAK